MNGYRVWLIGDTHFYHRNIIKYCNRPFDSVEEMNEQLIKNWNKVVNDKDVVYMMGDFALCGKDNIITLGKQLKGRKRLILGNHDQASIKTYFEAGFELVYNHPIIVDERYVFSHEPIVVPSGWCNIFAHVHDKSNRPDVTTTTFITSVERPLVNYTPILFDTVKQKMMEAEEWQE